MNVKPVRIRVFYDFECPKCKEEETRSLTELKDGACYVLCFCGHGYFVDRVTKAIVQTILHKESTPIVSDLVILQKAVAVVLSMGYNRDIVLRLAKESWENGDRDKEAIVRYILCNVDRDTKDAT